MNSAQFVREKIKRELNELDIIKQHNVNVVCQDEGDILQLINKELSELDGLTCCIVIDRIEDQHPAELVHFSLLITEIVPINRQRADFLSALDISLEIGKALNNEEQRRTSVENEILEAGVFQSTSKYKTLIHIKE